VTSLALDLGGTVRACPPEATLARVTPLFGRLGITRVADVTGLDSLGVPVAQCIRPTARNITVAQGKGVTTALARASAVMESVELWHAERVRPPDVVAAYREVASRAVGPRALLPGIAFARWAPDRPLGWLEGQDLVTGTGVLVPRCRLDLDTTVDDDDRGILDLSSNGLASGNSRAEAELHALCELIERDATARFHARPSHERAGRRMDLAGAEAGVVSDLLERLRADPAVEVAAWDVTGPNGVPAYLATLTERDSWRALGSFAGSGCHPVATVALARALTEAAQTRLTVITGSRDDVFPSFYRTAGRRLAPPAPGPGPVALPAGADPPGAIEDARDVVVAALDRNGNHPVAVVDHTDAHIGVAVVHAVVPGLQFRPAV